KRRCLPAGQAIRKCFVKQNRIGMRIDSLGQIHRVPVLIVSLAVDDLHFLVRGGICPYQMAVASTSVPAVPGGNAMTGHVADRHYLTACREDRLAWAMENAHTGDFATGI